MLLFKSLPKLSSWLIQQGFLKEAQAIKDLSEPEQYEEDWHEEAVQEFGSEPISEEEYTKQNFDGGVPQLTSMKDDINSDDADVLKQIAEQEGIQILYTGDEYTSSVLGSGMYGKVITGVYQGKNVAAKIIFEDEADENGYVPPISREGDIWKKILQAAVTLSPEMKRHIPQIYKINKGQLPYRDYIVEYEIIVMEQLFPLDKEMPDLIQHKKYEQHINRLLKDEEYLYKIAQAVTDYLNRFKSRHKLKIPELEPIALFDVIMSLGKLTYASTERIIKAIINYLVKQYNLNTISRKGKEILFENTERGGDLHDSLYTVIAKFIRPEGLPMFHGNSTEFWDDLPETSAFYRSLKEMAEQFGIKWMDLHFRNMMLDRDGNLKIVDVGAYNAINFTTSRRPTVTLPKNGNV